MLEQRRIFKHNKIDLPELKCETLSSGKRHYITPDGKKYPSITTILSAHSRKAIQEWRERVGQEEANMITARTSRRGTKIHNLMESYVKNEDVDLSKLMPGEKQAFNSIKRVIDENVGTVYSQESSLYSDWLRLAGRDDLICEFGPKTRLSIVDYKTKDKPQQEEWMEKHFIQGAAYAIMFEERTGIPVDRIVIICSIEGQKDAQVFIAKRDDYAEKLLDIRISYEKGEI